MPEQEQPGHWFVRDGSWWVCQSRCGTSRPFPSPFPKPEEVGPCVPTDQPPAGPDGVVHLMRDGYSATGCCYRTPFELPRDDRMTVDVDAVTCDVRAARR